MARVGLIDADDVGGVRAAAQPARGLLAQHPLAFAHERGVVIEALLAALAGDHQDQPLTAAQRLADAAVECPVGALGGKPVEVDAVVGRALAAPQPLGVAPVEPGLRAADRGDGRAGQIDAGRGRRRRAGRAQGLRGPGWRPGRGWRRAAEAAAG